MVEITSFLFVFVFFTYLNVSDASYCVVSANGPGIFVADSVHQKDSPFASKNSSFLDNTTIPILIGNFSQNSKFEKYNSIKNKSEINQPVLDQRWESFHDNHNHPQDIEKSLKNAKTSIFFSFRNYQNASKEINITQDQWHHFMANSSGFYNCSDTHSCSTSLMLKNNSVKLYHENPQNLWKIHDYTYFYTNATTEEQINTSNSTNCAVVDNGCLYIYVAMCKICQMNITISTINKTYNLSKNISGDQFWKTEQFSLKNFSNCFSIKVKTYSKNDYAPEKIFWAVGDVAYFSSNLDCESNKRYINLAELKSQYNWKGKYCENALNEKINSSELFPSELLPATETPPTETPPTETPPTKSGFTLPLYILIIIIPLILIIVVALICFFVSKRRENNKEVLSVRYRSDDSEKALLVDTPDGPRHFTIANWEPINRNAFTHYVHEVCHPNRKRDYLKEQFSTIPSGYLKAYTEGQKPENLEKNRFVKIYPYDDNRVKLQKHLDDKGNTSDYINASYVEGFNGPQEYIVTQNPLPNTVTDFWRMIWQEKIEYIVMISSSDEKYHQYWPEINKTNTFDRISLSVTFDQLEPHEYYNYRTLTLRRYGEMRIVYQLHFHSWSHEMLSPHVFLDFINRLLEVPHSSVPIVVHCMAGVGRSGTILLCDIALRTVAISGSFHLTEITKRMRECRSGMVQNDKQYQLAHLIILESLNYKDLSIEINLDYESQFSRLFEGNTTKLIWSEHLENREWIYEAVTPTVACTKYPKRNRYSDNNLLPLEHSRVVLQCKQPDYIHAMFVYDYKQTKNMIVAQQPLHPTLSDFWIMVLQNHVQTVVNLNELDHRNPGDCIFFPTVAKKILKLQNNMTVNYDSEENNYNYDKINVTVIFSGGAKNRKMSIINVKNWPKIKAVPESTDIMINIWDVGKRKKVQNFPILICCDDGITASGLVACFYYMTDKMLQEHKCDVVGAVRAVRRTHTNFINFEQFVFLHHCALAFYKNCMKENSDYL